jgi:hypothetical protein
MVIPFESNRRNARRVDLRGAAALCCAILLFVLKQGCRDARAAERDPLHPIRFVPAWEVSGGRSSARFCKACPVRFDVRSGIRMALSAQCSSPCSPSIESDGMRIGVRFLPLNCCQILLRFGRHTAATVVERVVTLARNLAGRLLRVRVGLFAALTALWRWPSQARIYARSDSVSECAQGQEPRSSLPLLSSNRPVR